MWQNLYNFLYSATTFLKTLFSYGPHNTSVSFSLPVSRRQFLSDSLSARMLDVANLEKSWQRNLFYKEFTNSISRIYVPCNTVLQNHFPILVNIAQRSFKLETGIQFLTSYLPRSPGLPIYCGVKARGSFWNTKQFSIFLIVIETSFTSHIKTHKIMNIISPVFSW